MATQRFTSMAVDELTAAVKDISIDEYMLKSRFIVKQKDDCFFKMAHFLESSHQLVSN